MNKHRQTFNDLLMTIIRARQVSVRLKGIIKIKDFVLNRKKILA